MKTIRTTITFTTPGGPVRSTTFTGGWERDLDLSPITAEGDVDALRLFLRPEETWPEALTGEEMRYLPEMFLFDPRLPPRVETLERGQWTRVEE